MKKLLAIIAVLVGMVSPAALTGQSPQGGTSTPSLGDLARQLKSQRADAAKKPSKVFTNDDLPARPPEEGATAAAGPSPAGGLRHAGGMSSTTSSSPMAKTPSTASAGTSAHDETYYRARMGELQTRMALHQRQLSVLQQKLAQNQMQFYPDPNKTLTQEYSRADVTKTSGKVAEKQAEIEADQKEMDDLRDQLRREGGDPGWLRGSFPPPPEVSDVNAEENESPSAEQKKPEASEKENPEDKKKTRDYWQSKFKTAREQLGKAQEEQQLAEDEVNLLRIQEARELNQDSKNEITQKIQSKAAELNAKRALSAKAQQILDELQKAFEESGAPEEWGKTD